MKADIIWLGSTDSTNEEAKRRITEIDNLSVLSVLEQTAGRGQRGNSWSSTPGENLTFSIILKFSIPGGPEEILRPVLAHEQLILTQITSVSVIEFLCRHGIKAKIKWPNDIYVGSEKICGMLIENSIRGNHISSSIIGIGLNINQKNFDVNIPNPTSMALCQPDSDFDIRLCLEEFTEIFIANISRVLSYRTDTERVVSQTSIKRSYLSNLLFLNEPTCFHEVKFSRKFRGIIRGISPLGLIQIEDMEKGELREFAFKEIIYISSSEH